VVVWGGGGGGGGGVGGGRGGGCGGLGRAGRILGRQGPRICLVRTGKKGMGDLSILSKADDYKGFPARKGIVSPGERIAHLT